tara:strand:- start:483 stop:989 length:507 start_codon:yes stop_codon:yes gene_type:complete
MKVKIGKYPTWRWYNNYLYNWFGYSPGPTVKVKIDRYDTWSMDTTLAHIVIPMLKQLRDTKHGVPLVDDEDVGLFFEGTNEEKWEWVMSEMLFAFESKLTNWEDKYSSGEMDYDSIPVIGKDGTEIGVTWEKAAGHTYKLDIDGLHVEQARIANGFRLFGKYYEALWD